MQMLRSWWAIAAFFAVSASAAEPGTDQTAQEASQAATLQETTEVKSTETPAKTSPEPAIPLLTTTASATPAQAESTPGTPAARAEDAPKPEAAKPRPGTGELVRVKVIPVREAIAKPVLYVLRRGLKEAQAEGVKTVIIDMETPGGELGVTLEIMEALKKFEGETLVYVNREAISAGAIISSVTDEIHFAPGGVIGAAAAVSGGGEDIPATMKQKINSYLNAKVRSFSAGKMHRAEVIRAMMDADFEFKIGDTVIKPKGELLSLTDTEAAKTYGDPSIPLLSAGTHESLDALLDDRYGKGGYSVSRLEVSWSEDLASAISAISPILMGLGLLCVFVEFKTPGFGVFGITGGLLLALVFFGHYAAGLSGHEAGMVFILGVALVAVELFLLPGTLVAGLVGVALMLGSLVWSMLDIWPGEWPSIDSETLVQPMGTVLLSVVIAVGGVFALARFLPRGWFWDKMILQAAVGGQTPGLSEPVIDATRGGPGEAPGATASVALGSVGQTVSALRPMGEVEVDGQRHEARASLGSLDRDQAVRVVGRSGRTLIVVALEGGA